MGDGSNLARWFDPLLCAGMLEREAADSLASGHLRVLLAFLCDQALDAEGMRDELTRRLDSADEARATMRKAAAEEKRRLNVNLPPLAPPSAASL